MQVAVFLAACMHASWHSNNKSKDNKDLLAVAIYITTSCAAGIVILCKPHLCEVRDARLAQWCQCVQFRRCTGIARLHTCQPSLHACTHKH